MALYLFFICFLFSLLFQFSQSFQIELKSFLLKRDLLVNITSPAILNTIPVNISAMTLCFGTPNSQCLNLIPSTNTYFIITQDAHSTNQDYLNRYDKIKSTTYKSLRHTLGFGVPNDFYKGQLSKDIIQIPQLNNHSNETMTFFQLESQNDLEEPLPIDGYLGLQMHYDIKDIFKHVRNSFIEHLYNTSLINRKSFALSINEEGGGIIEFGEDISDIPQCRAIINQDKDSNYWNCKPKFVQMGNLIRFLDFTKVIFNSLSNFIYINWNLGEFHQYILNKFKDKCHLQEDQPYITIICDRDIDIDSLDDIELRFEDNVTLLIKWKHVFKLIKYKEKEVYISLLVIDKNLSSGLINIGLPGFIDKKIVFNFADKSIGITKKALNNSQSNSQENKNKYLLYLYTLEIISTIIGIGVLINALFNKKQKRY